MHPSDRSGAQHDSCRPEGCSSIGKDQSRIYTFDWLTGRIPTPMISFWFHSGEELQIPVQDVLNRTKYFDNYIARLIKQDPTQNVLTIPLFDGTREAAEYWFCSSDVISNPSEELIEFGNRYEIQVSDAFVIPDSGCYSDPEPLPFDEEDLPDRIDIRDIRVLYDGYSYIRRRADRKDGFYYYCEARGCKGSLHVNGEGVVRALEKHTCETEDLIEIGRNEWADFLSRFEEIISDSKSGSHIQVLTQMKKEDERWGKIIDNSGTIVRTLKLIRPEEPGCVKDPFHDMPVAADFVRVHTVGKNSVIIAATDYMISKADEVVWLLIDGTFDAAPKQYGQLLTIIGEDPETGVFLPMVYILLKNKEKSTYEFALHLLKGVMIFPSVTWVTCDYEEGLRDAVSEWIHSQSPRAFVFGCRFHFTQCLTRKMKELYHGRVDHDKIELLGIFCSFPFLSRQTITKILDELSKVNHPMEEFVKYFVEYWMGKRFDKWNVSETELWMQERASNNGIESFNSRLSQLITSAHPRIDKLLISLRSIATERQRLIEGGIERNASNIRFPVIEEVEYRFSELYRKYRDALKPVLHESLAVERSLMEDHR